MGPISQPAINAARHGMMKPGGAKYPGPFDNLYDGLALKAGNDYERYAVRKNNELASQERDFQLRASLERQRLESQARQNEDSLATRRQGAGLGYINKIFGGVNGLLGGLFN